MNSIFPHTEYCQGGQIDDSTCNYATTDNTSSCVSATLQCENMMCSAVISGSLRTCRFTNIAVNTTISQPIQCCYCSDSDSLIPSPWWDCENITLPTPSLQSSSSGNCISNNYNCKIKYTCYNVITQPIV